MAEDGVLVIGTDLNTDKFEKKLEKLEQKYKKQEVSLQIKNDKIDEAQRKLDKFSNKLREISRQKIEVDAEIKTKRNQINNIESRMKAGEAITPQEYQAYGKLNNEITALIDKQRNLTKEQDKYNETVTKSYDNVTKLKNEYNLLKNSVGQTAIEIGRTKEEQQRFYDKENVKSITQSIDKIGNSMSGIIKKVAKWSLAIVGIRSVYLGIRSAMSTLSQYDDSITNRIDYLKWVLANTIKPIIEWIIQALYKILGFVGRIIYNVTGKNIFEKSGIEDYKKALEGSSKSAKELKKTLAGFDEMNVLNDNGTVGIGGKLPGDEYDASNLINNETKIEKATKKLIKKFNDLKKEMKEALDDPKMFDKAYGNWSLFMQGLTRTFYGYLEFVEGLTQTIGGILDTIVGIFTLDGEKIKSGISNVVSGIKKMLSGLKDFFFGIIQMIAGFVWGLIQELWSGIKGFFQLIGEIVQKTWNDTKSILLTIGEFLYDHVIKPITDFFTGLWEGIKTGAKNAWEGVKSVWNGVATWFNNTIIQPVKNFFGGMWNGLKDGARNAWEGIKSVFSSVGNWFKDIFSRAWQGVVNVFSAGGRIFVSIKDAIVNAFKWIVNGLIDGINNVVAIPFNGINSAFDGLRSVDLWGWKPFEWVPRFNVPQIPHLAKGGIINNPGPGVAIGGEKGQEGVLPLTDSQQMDLLGESIARHMVINLTNITELDGRQIARKVEQINNNNRFVLNR